MTSVNTAMNTSMKPMQLDFMLKSLQDGRMLSTLEGLQLLKITESGYLQDLKTVADQLREALQGEAIGWSLDIPLLLTNRCELAPSIYTYPQSNSESHYFVLSIDDIDSRIEAGIGLQADTIFVTGGLDSELLLPGLESPSLLRTYGKLLHHLREHYPLLKIHGFSPDEIGMLQSITNRSYRYLLEYLKDHGLTSLSGHGAEILVDSVRQHISPKMLLVKDWFEVMHWAYKLDLPATMTMSYGHFETLSQRIEHLNQVRRFLSTHHKAFHRFIPYPISLSPPDLATEFTPLNSRDRLKMLAIIRLFLGDQLPDLQVHWGPEHFKLALEEAQEGLGWGASHLGSSAAMAHPGFLNGRKSYPLVSQEELVSWIQDAGKKPVIRPETA